MNYVLVTFERDMLYVRSWGTVFNSFTQENETVQLDRLTDFLTDELDKLPKGVRPSVSQIFEYLKTVLREWDSVRDFEIKLRFESGYETSEVYHAEGPRNRPQLVYKTRFEREEVL